MFTAYIGLLICLRTPVTDFCDRVDRCPPYFHNEKYFHQTSIYQICARKVKGLLKFPRSNVLVDNVRRFGVGQVLSVGRI